MLGLIAVLVALFFAIAVPVMAVLGYIRTKELQARITGLNSRLAALEDRLEHRRKSEAFTISRADPVAQPAPQPLRSMPPEAVETPIGAWQRRPSEAAPASQDNNVDFAQTPAGPTEQLSKSDKPAAPISAVTEPSETVPVDTVPPKAADMLAGAEQPVPETVEPSPVEPADIPAAADAVVPIIEDAARVVPPPVAALVRDQDRPRPERQSLELLLGARGFVWIGGLSIALAGAFFVKYSLDEGLLSPAFRIALGLLFGLLLMVAGEWMRSRSSTIGQALVAAGFADLFASLFAAHAIYDLIPAAADFLLLAAVTTGAILAALRHGPFVGLVGIAGGFLTPALVSSGEPRPTALFIFLFFILFGAMVLWRLRRWWYVAALGLAGGLLWVLLFAERLAGLAEFNYGIVAVARLGEYQVPFFLLAVSALLIWTFDGGLSPLLKNSRLATPLVEAEWMIDICGNIVAVILLSIWLVSGGYNLPDWLFLIAGVVLHLLAARRYPRRELVGFISAALSILVLASMPLAVRLSFGGAIVDRSTEVLELIFGLGTILVLGGYGLSFGARKPVHWSGLSVAASAALFAVAYIDFQHRDIWLSWPTSAVLLAALHFGFAQRLFNRRGNDLPYRASFALHCVAVVGFIAAAVPLQVGSGWIAVIWSLILPPVIWIGDRLQEKWLRRIVWLATPGILITLFLSGFPVGDRPILNWLLYGVGVPFLSFAACGWLLRRPADQSAAATTALPPLENRGLLLLVDLTASFLGFLLISLEVRQFFHGAHLFDIGFSLSETTTLSLLWLLAGHVVTRIAVQRAEAKLIWAALLLAALGLVAAFFGAMLFLNPLVNPIDIGATIIFNKALYAYLAPLIGCLILLRSLLQARSHIDAADKDLMGAIKGVCLALSAASFLAGLLLITVEVRQFFHGGRLALADFTFNETATLAVAWLVAAVGLLWLGKRLQATRFAWAGLLFAVLGSAMCIFGPVGFLNPLFSEIDIGPWPILNWALYGYALPAICCFILANHLGRIAAGLPASEKDLAATLPMIRSLLGAVAILMGFVGVSILNRQLFNGAIVVWPAGTFITDLDSGPELYGYSLAWLLYGAALILLAVATDRKPLRHAAAGVILLAILKVFLIDAAGLTGLYRVASFLGLGLCLIALGYLYQRLVLGRRSA